MAITSGITKTAAAPLAPADVQVSKFRDYVSLVKPEITFLVAISAIAGFVLGSGGNVDTVALLIALLGISLTSAGACALNQYYERETDRLMKRTARRALASGRVEPRSGLIFGSALIILGLSILCPLTNPLTAILALVSVVLYLYIYTPLKKMSWTNTLVGAIPGALPVLGGYTAAANSVNIVAIILFGVLYFWQLPHFYAIAWMYKDDYRRGKYIMLPGITRHSTATAFFALGGTIVTIALTIALTGPAGLSRIYLWIVLLLGALLFFPTVDFARSADPQTARRLLKASVFYIPLFVLTVVLDALL